MHPTHALLTCKKRGWAGEATITAAVARGLAERGHRVTVAANPEARIIDRLEGSGVEILRLTLLKERPQVAWTLPRDMRRLAHYVREQGVALIHSNASFDTWTAALARRLHGLRLPLLRTKHNLKEIRETRTNRWYYGPGIDHLVVPSRAVETVLRRCPLIANEKIHRIPNGISLDPARLFQKGKAQARAELGIPAEAEVVAYISRLTRRKDPATFLRAALRVASERPGLRILVVGTGEPAVASRLEALAAGSPQVEVLGHRDDVPRLLAATDVFVLPSLIEPFGLAPLEAMLQGVTTIVSDAEGFQDFARHEENALIFPKGDVAALSSAIARALSDPALRARLATEGEKTVREFFHTDRMIDDLESLYERVLGQARR
ncbi:MAG: glycosyltransferase family 4 protein [Myxococcota bacterium]